MHSPGPVTPEFKTRLVLDILAAVRSQAEICRKHSSSPNLLWLWKSTFLERAHLAFQNDATRPAALARIAEREQVLGRLTLENEIRERVSSRLI